MVEPTIRYRVEVYTDERLRWFAEIETVTENGRSFESTSAVETCRQALELATKRIVEKRTGKTVPPQGGSGTAPPRGKPATPADLPGTHC